MRGAWAVGVVLLGLACTDGSETERSATSFCDRYDALAESLGANAKTIAPVEGASREQILDLADRAPDEELEDALEVIADLQPEALLFMERVQDGTATPDDFDADAMDRYVNAAHVLDEERHSLCD